MAITIRTSVPVNRFPQIASRIDQGVTAALDHAVQTCIAAADPLTRVDTGALVGNKQIERGGDSRTVTWTESYAGYQNDGTIYMSGTHFANAGFDAASPGFISDLSKVFS